MVTVPSTVLENYIIVPSARKQGKQDMFIKIQRNDWLHRINLLIEHTSQQLRNTTSVKPKDVLHCMLSSRNSLDQLCMHDFHGIPRRNYAVRLTVQSGSGIATAGTLHGLHPHNCTSTLLQQSSPNEQGIWICDGHFYRKTHHLWI